MLCSPRDEMLLPSIEVTGVANAMIEVFWHVQRYF